jgi:hypothetical protein
MQMVMMIFRTSLEHDIIPWVEEKQLPYTRLDGAQGKGETGIAPGSTTWGGSNSVVLLAVPDDRLNVFRDRVREFEKQLEQQRHSIGVPFHVFVLPCLQWL